jgi:hypothetical protein
MKVPLELLPLLSCCCCCDFVRGVEEEAEKEEGELND